MNNVDNLTTSETIECTTTRSAFSARMQKWLALISNNLNLSMWCNFK